MHGGDSRRLPDGAPPGRIRKERTREKWKIDRINELAHKKKTVGLTEAELTEQAALRREYLDGFRANMEEVLKGVVIQRPDGTKVPLKKKPLN